MTKQGRVENTKIISEPKVDLLLFLLYLQLWDVVRFREWNTDMLRNPQFPHLATPRPVSDKMDRSKIFPSPLGAAEGTPHARHISSPPLLPPLFIVCYSFSSSYSELLIILFVSSFSPFTHPSAAPSMDDLTGELDLLDPERQVIKVSSRVNYPAVQSSSKGLVR